MCGMCLILPERELFRTVLAALLHSAGWASERFGLFVKMQLCNAKELFSLFQYINDVKALDPLYSGPGEDTWSERMLVVVWLSPLLELLFMAFKGCDSQKEATLRRASFQQVPTVAAVRLQNSHALTAWLKTNTSLIQFAKLSGETIRHTGSLRAGLFCP